MDGIREMQEMIEEQVDAEIAFANLMEEIDEEEDGNVKAAQAFSKKYFGKILIGLEGANAYSHTGPHQFCVVIKTDYSDKRNNLLVVSPCPFSLDVDWVRNDRFRFATPAECERLENASAEQFHPFHSGTLVTLTSNFQARGRRSKFLRKGELGVVDLGVLDTTLFGSTEYGKTVRYSNCEVHLTDGTAINNNQFINASECRHKLVVKLQEGGKNVEVPVDLLEIKHPDLNALKKVVIRQSVKTAMLAGMSLLKPEIRTKLERDWALKEFDYGRGFIGLLYGSPGTGKTTLIKSLAAYMGRPVLRIDFGTIGSRPDDFEEEMERVMKDATRLNAILLIEEADQILMKRTSNMHFVPLGKISEVLQMLEGYEGVMLLTSNRAFELDPAVIGRINLIFEMPPFTNETREDIWLASLPNKLPVAGVIDFTALSQIEIDGRAIKMSVFNAARRAVSEGLESVPAGYFHEEALLVQEGVRNIYNDVRMQNYIDEIDN